MNTTTSKHFLDYYLRLGIVFTSDHFDSYGKQLGKVSKVKARKTEAKNMDKLALLLWRVS